jgi:hypothetical protein
LVLKKMSSPLIMVTFSQSPYRVTISLSGDIPSYSALTIMGLSC